MVLFIIGMIMLGGAIGGAFGTSDVGGETCKTLSQNMALKGAKWWGQVAEDFTTTLIITSGTWLNGTKMKKAHQQAQ